LLLASRLCGRLLNFFAGSAEIFDEIPPSVFHPHNRVNKVADDVCEGLTTVVDFPAFISFRWLYQANRCVLHLYSREHQKVSAQKNVALSNFRSGNQGLDVQRFALHCLVVALQR